MDGSSSLAPKSPAHTDTPYGSPSRFDALVRSLLRTAGHTGREALSAIVAELGTSLEARRVQVSIPCPGQPGFFKAIAIWPHTSEFIFSLAGTANEHVWHEGEVAIWGDLPARFPAHAETYARWGANSLVGRRMEDVSGRPLGILLVLFGAPCADITYAETLLRLYALRVVGELVRLQHEHLTQTTARRQAANQAALMAQETRFLDVFDHTEDSVFFLRVESEGRFVYERVNRRFTTALGLPPAAIIGRCPTGVLPAAAAARLVQDCRECVRLHVPTTVEQHITLPAGARVFRTRLMPVRDPQGQIFRLIGFATDITDLKHRQNLLDETEAITRVGGWDYDVATRRLLWTAGAYRVFARDPASFSPSLDNLVALHTEDERPAVRIAFENALVSGADFDFIAHVPLDEGRMISVHTLGQAEIVDGRVVRLFGAVRDITADEESDQLRLRLEAQLRRAQKMEAVGTLAGGIAHDFNNILAGIMGNVQLAGMELSAGSPLQRFLDQSYQGCIRARDLVRRMLTFSRQAEQPRVIAPLRPVVEEAIELLRASIPANVAIHPRYAEEALHALVDPGQIHQIVLNLGVNAAHAMRPGGGVLTVELALESETNAWSARHPQVMPAHRIRLTVRDTGCGIPADRIERVFEPFFTTKGPGEGSGLGLAMVHGIVENHGGAIVVESTVGAGTAFHLFFPGQARLPEIDGAASSAHETIRENPSLPTGSGQRILVVDDEATITALAEPILIHLGYEPRVFNDPHAALESFAAEPGAHAAVLTDLTMPGLDGLALAQALRALHPDIPILLMTGHLRPADLGVMRAAGIAQHLPKPFSMQTLAAKLREVIPRPPVA